MSKRSRRTMELRRILRILRESAGKRHEERSQIDMARDMICSSFDIVKRLRTLERETELGELPSSSMQHQRCTLASPSQPRDTIDLFFESITQTMKTLPPDLAAEGKAKIMQFVSNLELRSMQRTASTLTSLRAEANKESSPVKKDASHVNQEELTSNGIIDADLPDSETSSEIIEVPSDENYAELILDNNANSNDIGHLSEITLTTTQRNAKPSRSPPTGNTTVRPEVPTIVKGPVKIRRAMPSTVQAPSKPESVDQLRVVPINKLTIPSQYHNINARSNMNAMNLSTTTLNRNGQSQSVVFPNNILVNTTPRSNSSSHSDMINGTTSGNVATTGVLRKIRFRNDNSTKVITFQTQQQVPQQPPAHQNERQLPMRYSSEGSSPKSSAVSHGPPHGLTQVQALAQAQLRALRTTCPLMRNVPANRPPQP